jgi:hypothetical protein
MRIGSLAFVALVTMSLPAAAQETGHLHGLATLVNTSPIMWC